MSGRPTDAAASGGPGRRSADGAANGDGAGIIGIETFEVAASPAYTVHVGPGALARAHDVVPGHRVAIVSDAVVDALYGDAVAEALTGSGRDVHRLVVPAGEPSKSATVWTDLLSGMARAGFSRDDAVLALGGGVVGDLAGFTAASYMRGIPVVQVPTTLLAMADAAIGGKTGINLPEGKNLVGAFWQPSAVLMDVRTLRTLPEAVLHQGTVEVFKHGLLADASLAEAVLAGALGSEASDEDRTRIIAASGRVKAAVVAADEREGGARAHLNLGHTLAHALEAVSRHRLSHGEAVAWGLLYAAHLSRSHGADDWTELPRRLLARTTPRPLPTRAWSDVEPFLRRDKKNLAGRQRWVLLSRVGAPYVADDVPAEAERSAWGALLADAEAVPRPAEGGTT